MEKGDMEGTQRVFVKYKNEPLLDLMVKEDEKVGEFKEHLDRILVGNAEADRSTSVFRLMHNGKELQDNSTIIGNGVQNCDWVLLLKCPRVPSTNLKQLQEVAAVHMATALKGEGEDDGITKARTNINSEAEMRRLSEIIVSTLGKIRSLMAESSHTNYSSEISAMNNITVSHVFDSLMGDSSPGYRVSILRQWIGDIVPSEIPKTSSHSYAAMRTSIYFGITEVQRAISELSLLEEIRSGGATGDRARGSLGAPAPLPGFFRGAGALINSSLAQPTVLISPTWALRTSNATEGAVPGASGDRLFPVETIRMERLYEEELAQLAEMGFYDVEANIQALQMARGVVEDAIELLFEHFPRNMD